MSDNRKYYYLKLKENYFDDDSIVLLESMQDGVLYSNILLKLYLKSLKHGGRLQLDEDIPYTAQMIATITRQQIGTVERALQIFLKLGLVEVLDSGTFYMSNIELLIGQSSTEAERKRAARLQNKALSALRTSGGHLSDIRPPEIEIELEKEIEIKREIEKVRPETGHPSHTYGRYQNVFLTDEELADLQVSFPAVWEQYIEKLSEYMASTGKRVRLLSGGQLVDFPLPCFGKSGYFMPHCICQCQREAEEQRKAAEERQRRMERIKRRKAQGLQDRYLYDYTFSNDNRQNPLMDKAHAYVENWKEAYKSNIGLLLFGDVGTGKSFFAGCIANALLDQDVPVLMTNFPTILNRLTGMFSEDRSEFIASFDEYDLLIIDDLGVERSTEYAMEQMFFVIDSRYRSRRPMIITTNLKLSELKNPPDLAHARIYDRILERCAPILFDGKNFREENAGVTRQAAKDIVNSKHD